MKQQPTPTGNGKEIRLGPRHSVMASITALGSVVLASSCCLPLVPFLFAASAAGTSAFFVKARPFLLALSIFSIAVGFYQKRQAKRCQAKPSMFSTILHWFSTGTVFVFVLFPQVMANFIANLLAR